MKSILNDLQMTRDKMAAYLAKIEAAIWALGGDEAAHALMPHPDPTKGMPKKTRRLSAAGRAAISKASKLRWAKHRRAKGKKR